MLLTGSNESNGANPSPPWLTYIALVHSCDLTIKITEAQAPANEPDARLFTVCVQYCLCCSPYQEHVAACVDEVAEGLIIREDQSCAAVELLHQLVCQGVELSLCAWVRICL